MKKRYFDYAATTPVDPDVFSAMRPFFTENFGNPSSPHGIGQEALAALDDARASVAQHFGAHPQEIVFNAGATEGNNHAILGVARALASRGKHIIATSIEHASVFAPLEYLRTQGFDITYLPVSESGLISATQIASSIRSDTILVVVIHANNEIGTIQPIEEIAQVTHARGVYLFVDAVQSAGQICFDLKKTPIDFLTVSGHKMYGPKGVGVLFSRERTAFDPLFFGGDQERGRRAGTQNVALAVGLSKALSLSLSLRETECRRLTELRERLFHEIPQKISGVKINGDRVNRLANNVHFAFEGITSQPLLVSLDMIGIAASMGSACTSGQIKPSRVLKAIGLSDALASGALRLTMGRYTTDDDVTFLIDQLPSIINRLRQ